MLLAFYFALLMVTAFARRSENEFYTEYEGGEEGREPKIQESFNSPVVFDSSNFIRPSVVNGKTTYNVRGSVPPSAYIARPYGHSLPYTYNPHAYYSSYSPYGAPPYSPSAYGAMLNPAYVSAMMSRFAYANYERPYGRATYPGLEYIPNYYISGLGYSPDSVRRGPVGAPAPYFGVVPPVPPTASTIPAPGLFSGMAPPLPPTVSTVPASLSRFSNGLPGVAASITSGAWTPPGTGKGGQMASIRKTF